MDSFEQTHQEMAAEREAIAEDKKRLFLERYRKAEELASKLRDERSRIMASESIDPRDIPLTNEIKKRASLQSRETHIHEIYLESYEPEKCERHGKPHIRFVNTEITEQGIKTVPLLIDGSEVIIPEPLASTLVRINAELFATPDVYSNNNELIFMRIPVEMQKPDMIIGVHPQQASATPTRNEPSLIK